MIQNLRFSVLGCGRMGRRRIEAILHEPRAQLVSVCDSEEEVARAIGKAYGVAYRLDWRDILQDGADILMVCAPNHLHSEMAMAGLDAGKHVFCEKPVAPTVEEATRLVLAASDSGKTLTVGSNLRHFPNVRAALRALEDGRIGEIIFLRGWIGHEGWNLSVPWYRNPTAAGGGALLDTGAHLLDLVRLFLGEPTDCVALAGSLHHETSPLEDNAMAVFRTKEGRLAMVQASWTEWNGYFFLEICGSRGSIQLDARGDRCAFLVRDRAGHAVEEDFSPRPKVSCRDEFRAYCDFLLADRPPVPTGYDGLRVVRMAQGAYDSWREGRRVSLWTEEDAKIAERTGRRPREVPCGIG